MIFIKNKRSLAIILHFLSLHRCSLQLSEKVIKLLNLKPTHLISPFSNNYLKHGTWIAITTKWQSVVNSTGLQPSSVFMVIKDPYNSRHKIERWSNSHWPGWDKHTSEGCAPAQASREDPSLHPLIIGRRCGNSSLRGFDGQLGISRSGNWGCALPLELPSKMKQLDQHQNQDGCSFNTGASSNTRRCRKCTVSFLLSSSISGIVSTSNFRYIWRVSCPLVQVTLCNYIY